MSRLVSPVSLFAAVVLLLATGLSAQFTPPRGYVLVDDMILPREAVYGDSAFKAIKWSKGVVPYVFDPGVTSNQKRLMLEAMADWESVAAVQFVPRTNEPAYLHIRNSTSNSSFVGRAPWYLQPQSLNIFNWNYRFIMVHELGHALGYVHEHQRADRGAYISVNLKNLQDPNNTAPFAIITGATLSQTYDFDSVMHYSANAFAKPNTKVITVKSPHNKNWPDSSLGQRRYLSALDAAGMMNSYGVAKAPVIQSVTPASLHPSKPPTKIEIKGQRFYRGSEIASRGIQGSVVLWDAKPVQANVQFISPNELWLFVTPAMLSNKGPHTVSVFNPVPVSGGGLLSNSVNVVVSGGLFRPHVKYASATSPSDVAVADIDGDKDQDVVMLHAAAGSFTIALNKGDGSLEAATSHSIGDARNLPVAIECADFTGNKNPDVLVLMAVLERYRSLALNVYERSSTGVFSRKLSIPLRTSLNQRHPVDFVIGDIDGDRDPDAVVLWAENGSAGKLAVFRNDTSGKVAVLQLPGWARVSQDLVVADVSRDGRLDIVTTGSHSTSIWLGKGNNTFQAPTVLPATGSRIATGDLDLKNGSDIVLATDAGALSVYLNNGARTFGSKATTIALGDLTGGLAVADIDNDGDPDIVSTSSRLNALQVVLGDGSSRFSKPQSFGVAQGPVAMALANLDRDTDLDVAIASQSANSLSILINDSKPSGGVLFPGSREDFILATGVNGPLSSGIGHDLKSARAGDYLALNFRSPAGSLNRNPPILAGQLFRTGSAPGGWPGLPHVHFEPGKFVILLNGFGSGPMGPIQLPPGGITLGYKIPSGLGGNSLLLQALLFSSKTKNASFAASDGHEIRFVR